MGMVSRRISTLSPISPLSRTREREIGKKSGLHSRNGSTRKKPEQSIWSPMSAHNDSSTRSLTGAKQTSGPETPVDGYQHQHAGWSEQAGPRHHRRSLVPKNNQSDAPYEYHNRDHSRTSTTTYGDRANEPA